MSPGVIYGLYDLQNSEEFRYIGKTIDLKTRLTAHRAKAKRANYHLYCWWRSLEQEPGVVVLGSYTDISTEELSSLEVEFIKAYRSSGHRLVNHTDGGEGLPGLRHSDESKQKMSESRRGRQLSAEHKAKFKRAGPPANKGKHLSEETRRKMSQAKAGRPPNNAGRLRSPETRAKISKSLRQRSGSM